MVEGGLAKWGFTRELITTSPADIRSAGVNLESYELHVVKNHVVSFPCYYHLDKSGRIIDAKTNKELSIDKRERAGLYRIGITKALAKAQDNPGNLVFLYSPTGMASFEDNPPEDYATPYNIGQLYLLWYDGETFTSLGISINGKGEEWLEELFDKDWINYTNQLDEKAKITNWITNPVSSSWSLDDFLHKDWRFNQIVFSSKSYLGIKQFNLQETLQELENSLTGRLKATINGEVLARKLALQGGSTEMGYKSIIHETMIGNNLSTIPLAGGCGGGNISKNDLFNNPISSLTDDISNLSSDYRRVIQREEQKWNYHDGHCVICDPKQEKPVKKVGPCNICIDCEKGFG